jgi:predicted dehydrogenase
MSMKRREFLKSSVVAGSTAAIGKPQGANDQIRVGLIGCGSQGNSDANQFARIPNVRIVALADVYEGSLKSTLENPGLKLDQTKTPYYKDFRRVLDDRNIDAVIIATPDHWHALTMIMACQAGKDVYVEKPLSLTLEEGRLMVNAARKHNRVVQVGTQQRSAKHFQRAVELVREGRIGKIGRVHTWNHDQESPDGIGNPADTQPPSGLDWDFYLGPAPKVPFNENRFLGNFRWFWDYSGGKMTDWGVHLIDIVQWAMNVDAPVAVDAMGGKFTINDNRETPDTLMATFEYPKFIATYENRAFSGRGLDGKSYGILFVGTDASLFVDRSGLEIIPEYSGRRRDDLFTPKVPPARMGLPRADLSHLDHCRNFIECMKTRKLPTSDVEIAHRSTSTTLLANIALRSHRRVKWDGQTEKVIGDAEASRWLSKAYRAPWKLTEG